MGTSEQACALVGRETAECCLQLFCLSFQADPAQFPNEFDDFAGCLLLWSLVRNSVWKLTSLHTTLLRMSFAQLALNYRVVACVQASEPAD
jgi:hypothetical protein